ncbi:cation efflux protein, CzcI family [Aquabacterium sp.]|uniref:cation efflux protein, CzcI family n=1 Tax=Aquabacterium sp. TaxID=1872578 RepID=UPI0037834BA2
MRRFVIVLMMLLLPLQSTWAAAAAYCAHETEVAVKHVGHHQHEHKPSQSDVSKFTKSSGLGDADSDCGYCHLSTVQWLQTNGNVTPPLTCVIAPPDDPMRIGSHIGSGPERPDRSLAA